MKRRILFVGDTESLRNDFCALSAGSESPWLTTFVRTAPEACGILGQVDFAAVVTDVQLSDTNGVDLLDEVMRTQPKALRLILSDLTETRSTVKCLGKAHHHLLKPCDAATLRKAIDERLMMETWLPSAAVQGLIAQMRRVPSPPTIYFQVLAEIQSPNSTMDRIGELISQDPAITAKVLQLANSAVFGLQLQVMHPAEAVAYIGLETTKSLVLMAHTFSSFDQLQLPGFSIDSVWCHSVLAGRFARQIAQVETNGIDIAEQAFAAGLLHDIGKLLFAANLPQALRQALALAQEQQTPLWQAEHKILGASHAELGACLLGIWGLPVPIVHAVALHHDPPQAEGEGFSALTAVHAANILAHEACQEQAVVVQAELNLDYLRGLGVEERVEEWRRRCLATEEQTA